MAKKSKKKRSKKDDSKIKVQNPANKTGLRIDKGSRHCKILDENDEVVFRTTNLRDAEAYMELVEENERLRHLLESRGIAPHRIYLLADDEKMRGKVNQGDDVAASEVVIVAKSGDGIVVRHLEDGREEIVDLDEIERIEGGIYLQASEPTDEVIQVVARIHREQEEDSFIGAWRTEDTIEDVIDEWSKTGERPGSEYRVKIVESEADILVLHGEISLED
jgi:hypothetical protein